MNDDCRSVLFAEISGGTQLREKLDSGEALRAVDRCVKRMERAVEAAGGRLVKMFGNNVMAVFDHPEQAFRAAREMQLRIADLPPVSGVKLTTRIGFAHGPISEDQDRVVGDTVDAAAHLAGLAEPGQILTSEQSLFSPAFKHAMSDLGTSSVTGPLAGSGICELVSALQAPPALSLRYGERQVVLNEQKRVIIMGRDAQCDLEIHDRRASRRHARIERHDGRIVLIDSSSNGTYVTLNGEPERFLRGGECMIHGKGLICFAASANSPDADCVRFEQS